MASRVVLAHPRKLRVIAESTRKTDKLDAQVLAKFLALDMIPQAHRSTPRVRQHRALVRQRQFIQRRITSAKCKVRHILARYNADVKHLFTAQGQAHLAAQKLLPSDRFVLDQLTADLKHYDDLRCRPPLAGVCPRPSPNARPAESSPAFPASVR